MSAAFIRLADSGAPWAKVQLREGDDVADVLTRACAEFTNWGTNASRASCFLVACTHGDKPSADAEAAALSGACLESTWPLLRAGVVPRSFLLVRPQEAATGAFGERRAAVLRTGAHPILRIAVPGTRVTLLLRSGRGTRVSTLPYSFSSAADFAEFSKTGNVQRVSKNGVPLAAVRTLAEAQSGAADDILCLTAPFDTLGEDVSLYELAPCKAEEMAGLTSVTPILDDAQPALRACASMGLRVFSPNGVDCSLRRSLHTLARMVRLVR